VSNFSLSGCLTFPFQDKFLFDLQTNASRTMFLQTDIVVLEAPHRVVLLRHSGVRPGWAGGVASDTHQHPGVPRRPGSHNDPWDLAPIIPIFLHSLIFSGTH
jgi:hypothetical protein